MSIVEDLNTFSFNRTPVVTDRDKFRSKLNIGLEAFKLLATAKTAGKFGTVLLSGGGTYGMTYAAWYASLSFFGKLGLAFGVVATPAGWFIAGGTAAAGLAYGLMYLYKKIKQEAVTEIPQFINSPVDVLGASICAIFCPVLLRIAHADRESEDREQELIKGYFINEWGISEHYIDKLIERVTDDWQRFTYDKLRSGLLKAQETGDIKYSTMAKEIVRVANSVMNVDGRADPREIAEIKRLEKALVA